jgi:FlaA1/EpsC-like NDP-sugar epimerase
MDHSFWQGRTVLITGICGSVGQALLTRLGAVANLTIIGLDIDEPKLVALGQTRSGRASTTLVMADIRDREAILRLTAEVDVIIHAAAAKHVDLCEVEPTRATTVNIDGLLNIVEAARRNKVARVIFTSSDKAVEPTSVMGATKLLGERLFNAQLRSEIEDGTVFASVRFGNICGSSDSVIPKFRQQIATGGPVTITDPHMTRFLMSMSHAIDIILAAAESARSGDIYVPRMSSTFITTLAEVMIADLAPKAGLNPAHIGIEIIGAGAGEKMFEKLCTDEELSRLRGYEDHLVIAAAEDSWRGATLSNDTRMPISSHHAKPLEYRELQAFLHANGLLDVSDP